LKVDATASRGEGVDVTAEGIFIGPNLGAPIVD
jgi:hypothetical protein